MGFPDPGVPDPGTPDLQIPRSIRNFTTIEDSNTVSGKALEPKQLMPRTPMPYYSRSGIVTRTSRTGMVRCRNSQ